MNFSPSSTSLPRLSKDGLRIQPATEILHHQPLADRSRSGRRDREFKVKDHKVSVRRDRGLLYIEIRETAQPPEILSCKTCCKSEQLQCTVIPCVCNQHEKRQCTAQR